MACGAFFVLLFAVGLVAFRRLEAHLDRIQQEVAQIEPLLALFALLDLEHPLPPMRGYAIAPDFAVLLYSLIHEVKPRTMVETGSGVSTVIAAYCLKALGRGHLFSLESDAEHARRTRDELA